MRSEQELRELKNQLTHPAMKIAVGDSTDDVSHGIKIVALTLRWALGSDSEFIEFVKFLAKSTTKDITERN